MKLSVTIHVEGASAQQVAELLGGGNAMSSARGNNPQLVVTDEGPQPNQAENPPEAELSDDQFDQPQRTAPANDTGRPPVDEVVSAISNKPAKTVTLAENVQGREGDEVQTPDGELGIIAACYRGKAVVQFEDGTGELYPGPDLKSREAPGQHAEPDKGNGVTAESLRESITKHDEAIDKDPLGLNEGEAEVPEEITRAMLLDQARAAVDVVGPDKVFQSLKDAAGVGKVKDINPDAYQAVYKVLVGLQQVDA